MTDLQPVSIVTGGGSGIGRALAHELASTGRRVLIIGRGKEALEDAAAAYPDRIVPVAADLAMWEGQEAVRRAVESEMRVEYLVHNAAVLAPIGPLSDIEEDEWRYHFDVNLNGPLFLTRTLLPSMGPGSRILHISTGAAHNPVFGWGAYCTSKAAFRMLWRCLDLEFREKGIRVGSARPGVVDTPMQGQIRESHADRFPDVERFRRLKAEGELLPPEKVAQWLLHLLLDTDDDAFAGKEWDVREGKA
jgi:benzil reductase ((S)-benzoin forming)